MKRNQANGESDDNLVKAAREGESRAFEKLLRRHEGQVLRVLRLMGLPERDLEDVAQEVFVKVFRHLDRFRRGKPFGAWLYRITINAAHDYRSRSSRLLRSEVEWSGVSEDSATADPGPDERLESQAGMLDLELALRSLSTRERAVFVLREVEELSTREVAHALGITAITVRRHLSRARQRLQRILANYSYNN